MEENVSNLLPGHSRPWLSGLKDVIARFTKVGGDRLDGGALARPFRPLKRHKHEGPF